MTAPARLAVYTTCDAAVRSGCGAGASRRTTRSRVPRGVIEMVVEYVATEPELAADPVIAGLLGEEDV